MSALDNTEIEVVCKKCFFFVTRGRPLEEPSVRCPELPCAWCGKTSPPDERHWLSKHASEHDPTGQHVKDLPPWVVVGASVSGSRDGDMWQKTIAKIHHGRVFYEGPDGWYDDYAAMSERRPA